MSPEDNNNQADNNNNITDEDDNNHFHNKNFNNTSFDINQNNEKEQEKQRQAHAFKAFKENFLNEEEQDAHSLFKTGCTKEALNYVKRSKKKENNQNKIKKWQEIKFNSDEYGKTYIKKI